MVVLTRLPVWARFFALALLAFLIACTPLDEPTVAPLVPSVPATPAPSVPSLPTARATLIPTAAPTLSPIPPTPLTTHPRLWLTANDLPRLRTYASVYNPHYQSGLAPLAARLKQDMDAGRVPAQDTGDPELASPYVTESYAELFAFLSLVENDPTARADYARRARTLLMYAINAAAPGASAGKPFRDPKFAISARAFQYGEAFALTVDWIYPSLTADDKKQIRQVFLRWISENLNANIASVYEHPQPVGATNSIALTDSTLKIRWATSHRFAAHLRNIGLMAMALDEGDDAGGTLRGYLKNAIGAWLYVFDYATRYELRGGLPAQGFEYGTEQLGAVAQFLFALRTAGLDDPAQYGAPAAMADSPFWDDVITAYLTSTAPAPQKSRDDVLFYPLASYGDTRDLSAQSVIALFAPLGLTRADRADAARWIVENLDSGISRSTLHAPRSTLLSFLLFDPTAPSPPDPRPPTPTAYFAAGSGRILARTDWSADATWLTYKLGWNQIEHQQADANQIEFYRRGEWLTKGRAGQGANIGSSDYHNTLAIQNTAPATFVIPAQRDNFARGSQWFYNSNGDGIIHVASLGDGYAYILGDSTTLYDSNALQSTDIVHVSRALVWLKPDHLIIYDRADSGTRGRFKRFWLNTPTRAAISGNRATVTTASGQRLYVTTLLPTNATMTAEAAEPLPNEIARGEPMQFRLRVQAALNETTVRFLHVLQGADAGVNPSPLVLIEGKAETRYAGVVVENIAVLFREHEFTPFQSVTYAVPATTIAHLVTGLRPNGDYDVQLQNAGDKIQVTIANGGASRTDGGGVLVIGKLK